MDKRSEKLDGWCSHCGAPMECTYLVEKYRIKGKKGGNGSDGSHGSHGEIITLICDDCRIKNAVLNFSDNDKK